MRTEKDWQSILSRLGVRPPEVAAWAGSFAAKVDEAAFTQGRPEMLEFLAQILHESSKLSRLTESLNYAVPALLSTFSRKRISEADAKRLGRVPNVQAAKEEEIANTIYGGEWGKLNLGNTQPGDGWRFRGSGLIQITGRANFQYIQDKTGLDVVTKPDILRTARPEGVTCAIQMWKKLVPQASSCNTVACRKAINGGTLGLDEVLALRTQMNNIFA